MVSIQEGTHRSTVGKNDTVVRARYKSSGIK